MIVFIILSLFTIFIFIHHWNVKKRDQQGYHVLNMFTEYEVNHLLGLSKDKNYDGVYEYITTHPRVLRNIRGVIGEGYDFQNYLLSIEKSSVSTCHRDENGQYFNRDVKHPSYTILFYLKKLHGCLDILENSHTQHSIVNMKKLKTIECVPGQAIIFDSDMIHSGTKQDVEDTTRIQLKLHHKDDRFPKYLENMKISLDASKDSGGVSDIMKSLSCSFPFVGDMTRNGQYIPDFLVRLYKDITYGKGKYETNSA